MSNIFQILNERAKELNCLYATEELLKDNTEKLETVLLKLIKIIPAGWQYSTICEARITVKDKEYKSTDFKESEYIQTADLIVDNNIIGKIEVFYSQFIKYHHNNTQFLPEEQRLLNTIADRLGYYIFFCELKKTIDALESVKQKKKTKVNLGDIIGTKSDEHWKWRYKIAEKIAEHIDLEKYNLQAVYLIGSTKSAKAEVSSDIDLMIHFKGTKKQRTELEAWIEGWSLCLSEFNYIKTGYAQKGGLIDLHIITDKDIQEKNSFALMINSTKNEARLLKSRKN